MMTLWTKQGCRPQSLPDADHRLSDDWLLTPLEGYPDAITACGWSEAPPAPTIDPATQQLGWDGAAWTVEPIGADALERYRAGITRQIEARAAEAFLAGYAPTHPDFAAEHLQVRGAEDRTNWLTSQASYSAAVAAGAGDVVDASFRTAENRTITVSYAAGLQILLGMAAWGRAIMARSWALKDAVAAGQTVSAKDIETGWPA